MSTSTLRMGYSTMDAWNRTAFDMPLHQSAPSLKRKLVSPRQKIMPLEQPDSPVSPAPLQPSRAPTFAEAKSNWSPPPSPRTRSIRIASPIERHDSGTSTPALSTADQQALSKNLYAAACAGDIQHCRLLLSLGAPANSAATVNNLFDAFTPAKPGNLSALAGACANGQLAAARLLISAGAAINPTMKQSSSSPLHQACKGDNAEMAAFLLERDANINTYDAFRTTPLMIACRHGSPDLVALLLSYAPDVHKLSFINTAAIHFAIWRRNEEIMELLLEAGANPDLVMGDGSTSLHVAALSEMPNVAQLLLQYGADPLKKNEEWKTPLQLASELGNWEVASVLAEAETLR